MSAKAAYFVAAAYIYDQLAMPEGFWAYGDRSKRRLAPKLFEQEQQNGPVYAHMVWTSKWVFTPAVLVSAAGFISMLVGTDNLWLIAGGVAVIAIVVAFYWLAKPRLGTD